MNENILIVDDESAIRDMVRIAFEIEEFVVFDASNVHQASKILEESKIDLILLDWMMPGLSGMEVLLAIREHYDANELPILMCTAREESDNISEAIECGANDYLQKPVDMPTAIARINSHLERRKVLQSLSDINRDLEQTLAQRTRDLIGRGGSTSDAGTEGVVASMAPSSDVQELMRLANWLRESSDAKDPTLLAACADSITTIARRLAAA